MKRFVFLLITWALVVAVAKRNNQAREETQDKGIEQPIPKEDFENAKEFPERNFQPSDEELITYVKVDAMTGDIYNAQSSSNHGLVIVLMDGTKHEAELPNYKARDQPYEIELSAQSDFQPSLVCSKEYIKEVYLKARGNDGWYIASIDTYTKANEGYTKLTADPDFNMWLDGNEEYPYDAKKHILTMTDLITYIKVEAMTGDVYQAESTMRPGLVMVLKNGSKCEAELPNNKARNKPYEIELSAQSDFQPSLVCSKEFIKEVYLEARSNDGWYIASIDTYTKANEGYTKLTADPDFNKWLDGNEEYPYDAKKHILTMTGKKK